jgi:hypothetical protein
MGCGACGFVLAGGGVLLGCCIDDVGVSTPTATNAVAATVDHGDIARILPSYSRCLLCLALTCPSEGWSNAETAASRIGPQDTIYRRSSLRRTRAFRRQSQLLKRAGGYSDVEGGGFQPIDRRGERLKGTALKLP